MMDVHTHILPGMDDGAVSVREAQKMLALAAGQGIGVICLTPHYYHYDEPPDDFYKRRALSLQEIEGYAAQLNITLIPGSETYLTPNLLSERDLSGLCINRSRYLLLEAPFESAFSGTIGLIERIMSNFDVTPIMAHIERYPPLLKTNGPLSDLLDMGCLTQINLCSLDGDFLLRRKLLRYFEEDKVHFIGTDCHDPQRRPPDYTNIELLRGRFGNPFMDDFFARAKDLLL